MNDDSPTASPAEGHRERMRQRFLAGEETALSDEALLELLLTFSIPRRDVKPLALALLAKFGRIGAVIAADQEDLKTISGIKENSVTLLKLAARISSSGVGELLPPVESPPEGVAADERSADVPEGTVSPDVPPAAVVPAKSRKFPDQPKLQVSNGYLLEPAQNAQILSFVAERPDARKVGRSDMMEGTGLSDRQIESLASVATAMGLMVPRTQLLTSWGKLVNQHDLFLDSLVTLEFSHFLGAGNPRNLVWFMVFNDLLVTERPTDQSGWSSWLREKLSGQYSDRTLAKHIAEEVRFVLDAYNVKNFKKLNLLIETPDKTIGLRRYTALQPLTLAAMIYLLGDQHQARLVPFSDLYAEPGSPGRVFGLDAASMRQMVETLHQKGWIRFEVRHGLDQVRLVDGFTPLEFLSAAYENRSPEPGTISTSEPERLLL